MGIAHLEKHTRGGASLLEKVFDECVDDLGDHHTKGKEDDLELSTKEKMRCKAAKRNKHGNK